LNAEFKARLKLKGTTVFFWMAAVVACGQCQVIFYGGDFDGRNGAPSKWTSAFHSMYLDDFNMPRTATLDSIWGNFQLTYVPTQAYYEIRSGVSVGNGGTLLDSGTISVQVTPTGRSEFGLPESQVLGHVSLTLDPGTYWLGIAPVGGFFDSAYISTTSGGDAGPVGDPNPPPSGSPLANGNSFFNMVGWNFVDSVTTTLGPGTWDFSYGVSEVPEPSPTRLLILAAMGMMLKGLLRKPGPRR
jgi:hypothetical protein